MQKKKDWSKTAAVFTGCILLLVFIAGIFALGGAFTKEVPTLDQTAIDSAITQVSTAKDAEILGLQGQIIALQEAEAIVAEEVEAEIEAEEEISEGYLLDNLFLESSIIKAFSDRELNLFDGKVTFDEDEFDAEEYLTLDSLVLSTNEEDFADNVFLAIPEDGVGYYFEFESSLNTSLIDSEDTLAFNFLGNLVEVSDWDGTEVTFYSGSESFISEGETADGVVLEIVLEDAVYVTVGEEGKKILEGKTAKVGDLEIFVKEVIYTGSSTRIGMATLVVGSDVENVVNDGEEFEEDSIWEWAISSNSLGIVMVEDFVELDDEYPVFGIDEAFCLPNEYVCFKFDGLLEEDKETLEFEMETEGGLDYVEILGNFISGFDDFDVVYLNTTGIYDEDFNLLGTSIEIGDTDVEVKLGTNFFKIKNVKFAYDLTDVLVDGTSLSSNEDNYLTKYGIMIENPENSCEDQEMKIYLPEEKAEGSITIF